MSLVAIVPGPQQASASQLVSEMLSLISEQRVKLIRFRDSSHLRRFSETSTKQRNSLVTGLMHCSVATHRRWNQDLQYIIESTAPVNQTRCSAAERRDQINAFLESFREEACRVTKRFIETYHFDGGDRADSPRSANDTDAGGSVGSDDDQPTRQESSFWASQEDDTEGLSLRLSLFDDPIVAKRAKLEVRLQYQVLSQLLEQFPVSPLPITVYPQVVCRYAGHYVSVSAAPGRGAAASMNSLSSAELAVALEYVGEALNVTSYDMVEDDGTETIRHGPPSASVFEGADGRIYAETLLGFLPHFPPGRGAPITNNHTLFLRLEAVLAAPEPVSPGAFVTYGGRSSRRLREQTTRCAKKLTLETVPRIAKELVTNPPPSVEDLLSKRLKPNGINVAFLGIVLSHVHVASLQVRRMIFTEMVARACKAHLDGLSIDSLEGNVGAMQQCCAELCHEETQLAYFRANLSQRVLEKFPGTAALHSHVMQSPFTLIDTSILIRRVARLSGMLFSPGVSHKGTSPFHFSIDKVVVRCQLIGVTTAAFAHDHNVLMDSPVPTDGSYSGEIIPVHKYRPRAAAQVARVDLWAYATDGASVNHGAAPDANNTNPTTNSANAMGPSKTVVMNAISDILRHRASHNGPMSIEYAYDLLYAAKRIERDDPSTALQFANQAMEVLGASPRRSEQLTNTLVHCLCERALILGRLGKFEDVQRDLDDATTLLGARAASHTLAASSNNGTGPHRFSAFGEDNSRRQSIAVGSSFANSANLSGISPRAHQAKAIGARIFSQLADALESAGKFAEAEAALRNVLHIQQTLLGHRHASVGTAWGALGFNLLHQGIARRAEAEDALKKDLEISEAANGRDHPSVAESIGNLAFLYDTMGRYEEAEALHRRDVELTARAAAAATSPGSATLNLATSKTNLGITLYNLHRFDDAEPLLQDALNARIDVLGQLDKAVALSYTNLALVKIGRYRSNTALRGQGLGDRADLISAEEHALKAVSIIQKVLSPTHRLLRPALEHLLAVYACTGDAAKGADVRAQLAGLEDATAEAAAL